jgi:hypothetical protein
LLSVAFDVKKRSRDRIDLASDFATGSVTLANPRNTAKMFTLLVIGSIVIIIGYNLVSLAERRPPSRIHDPHGYKNHREKKVARYVSGCLLLLVGAFLILIWIGKFLSGE